MFILKLLIILFALSIGVIISIMYISGILEDKPKSNKFRQWWSNHIVDLDSKYEE
jgi:hypothetical protein